MRLFFAKNRYLLLAISFAVVLLGIIISISTTAQRGEDVEKTLPVNPIPTLQTDSLNIEKIVPDEPQELKAGAPQLFNVYFDGNVSPNDLIVDLSYIDITQDNPPRVVVKTLNSQTSPVAVSIKTQSPILERKRYSLIIKTADNNTVLVSKSYLSGDIPPTPVPSNSPSLITFLPHKTDTYTLEYLQTRNLYVFHFIFNSALPGNTSTQFEKAKTEALDFIKSKGIDPAGLTIEFRRS